MRVGRLALAASFALAACTAGGHRGATISPDGPGPATSSPPSVSPSPTPSGVAVVVRGVTVNLGPACLLLARREGVDLVRLVRGDLGRVTSLLPRMRTRVDVVVHRGAGPPAGIGGYTEWSTGHVHIYLHAAARHPAVALRTWLPFTLAHEVDHAARILRGPGIGDTLLAWFVAEGMADRFAEQAFPSIPPSVGDHALSAQQTAGVWARARPRLQDPQTILHLRRWFLGRGGIPRWAGYTIGYDIVSAYLERHPGETAADLVTLGAARVLHGSDFRP